MHRLATVPTESEFAANMNHTTSTRALSALSLSVALIFTSISFAQDSDVDSIKPSQITQSLISRSELNRLINQPPRNGNPLRRSQTPLGSPIRDSSVKQASFQQEEPIVTPGGFVLNTLKPKTKPKPEPLAPERTEPAVQPQKPTDQPMAFGPLPSSDLESYWDALDMLSSMLVGDLGEQISEQRAKIDASLSLGIDNEAKTKQLKQLEVAGQAYQQSLQNSAAEAGFQTRITKLDEVLERLHLELKKPADPLPVDQTMTIEAMQISLRDQEAELTHARTIVVKIQDQIQERDKRMALIPEKRLQKREEANLLHEELLLKQAAGTDNIIALLSVRALELAATTEVQALEQEASWHELSREKLPLEKSIQQRTIQPLELEIKAQNTAIPDRKQKELEKQIQLARQKAFEADPALKDFTEQTTKLAQSRADLAEKVGELQDEKLRVDKQHSDVHSKHDQLETALETNGKDSSSGLLIEVHRNLIRPYEGMARIKTLENERRLARSNLLKLRSEVEKFADPQAYIRDVLQIENDEKVAGTTLVALALEAIETHRKQLVALANDNEKYVTSVDNILALRKLLLEEIAATRELVDTHALWVQSAEPVSINLLQKSGEGAGEFFDFEQWKELGNSIVRRVRYRPYECVVGMFGLLIAFFVGRRFKG